MENIRKNLAKELSEYINKKKTQEECSGFIEGFERACDLIEQFNSKFSKDSKKENCTIEEHNQQIMHFGNCSSCDKMYPIEAEYKNNTNNTNINK